MMKGGECLSNLKQTRKFFPTGGAKWAQMVLSVP